MKHGSLKRLYFYHQHLTTVARIRCLDPKVSPNTAVLGLVLLAVFPCVHLILFPKRFRQLLHYGRPGRDSHRFPSHKEVLRYLEDFACKFKWNELVRYKTEVKHVGLEDGKFKVRSMMQGGNGIEADETYDAVLVCNGHYTEPRIAEVPGIEKWFGKQIHIRNYRVPEPYKNLVVVIIGSASSGADISVELAAVAKEVHIAARSALKEAFGKQPGYDNMWLHPMVFFLMFDRS